MGTVRYRPAERGDAALVVSMVERCSAQSLNHRFNGRRVTPQVAASWLGAALDDAGIVSWVAVAGSDVVAVATGCRQADAVEVAVLVEDGWQRRGVGTGLLCRLVAAQHRGGVAVVRATLAADRLAVARSIARRLGAELRSSSSWGEAEVEAIVGAKSPAGEAPPARAAGRTTGR